MFSFTITIVLVQMGLSISEGKNPLSINDNNEALPIRGNEYNVSKYLGFCEIECMHKCKKTPDLTGCSYDKFNKECIIMQYTDQVVLVNKFNSKAYLNRIQFLYF